MVNKAIILIETTYFIKNIKPPILNHNLQSGSARLLYKISGFIHNLAVISGFVHNFRSSLTRGVTKLTSDLRVKIPEKSRKNTKPE
jgi:hypothetical protein